MRTKAETKSYATRPIGPGRRGVRSGEWGDAEGYLRWFSAGWGARWALSLAGAVLGFLAGCSRGPEAVIVYAAQDRVFAEPLFREFTRQTGIEVRALYDNEATKTTGLANRLRSEAARPQADLWWSNEEMRTRQLAGQGILETNWIAFGQRERVFVVSTRGSAQLPLDLSLAGLTNAAYRGRVAIAYPVFGSTLTHFLALRQRWGEKAWQGWCRALIANRPLVVDGNSMVVRLVARGDAWIGLTDSDDVRFGQREALPVSAQALRPGEGLALPNSVALVNRAGRAAGAADLAEFLSGADGLRVLRDAGAVDAARSADGGGLLGSEEWGRLLAELDPAVKWIEETFVR